MNGCSREFRGILINTQESKQTNKNEPRRRWDKRVGAHAHTRGPYVRGGGPISRARPFFKTNILSKLRERVHIRTQDTPIEKTGQTGAQRWMEGRMMQKNRDEKNEGSTPHSQARRPTAHMNAPATAASSTRAWPAQCAAAAAARV